MTESLLLFNQENATQSDLRIWQSLRREDDYETADEFMEVADADSWRTEYNRLLSEGWLLTRIGAIGFSDAPVYRFEKEGQRDKQIPRHEQFRNELLQELEVGQATIEIVKVFIENHELLDKRRSVISSPANQINTPIDAFLRRFNLIPELEQPFDEVLFCSLRIPRQFERQLLKSLPIKQRIKKWLESYYMTWDFQILCLFDEGRLVNVGVDLVYTGL